MAKFSMINSGGGTFTFSDRDSIVLGPALQTDASLSTGTTFRPATGDDRDALVAYLNAMDYSARTVEVVLQYPVEGEGIYRIRAERNDTTDELNAWIENVRKEMAKRLGLKDPSLITVTITEL